MTRKENTICRQALAQVASATSSIVARQGGGYPILAQIQAPGLENNR